MKNWVKKLGNIFLWVSIYEWVLGIPLLLVFITTILTSIPSSYIPLLFVIYYGILVYLEIHFKDTLFPLITLYRYFFSHKESTKNMNKESSPWREQPKRHSLSNHEIDICHKNQED